MSSFLTEIELDRERTVRRYVCPTCRAERNKPCRVESRSTRQSVEVSHTSRYRKAVVAGLVPPLPGGGHAT